MAARLVSSTVLASSVVGVVGLGCGRSQPPSRPDADAAVASATTSTPAAASATVSQGDTLERLAQSLLTALVTGDHARVRERLSDDMASALAGDKLPALWPGIEQRFGKLRGRRDIRREPEGAYQVVTIGCRFEHAVMDVRMVFDEQRRLSGLFVREPERDIGLPSYADPARYDEHEVTVGSGRWSLPGSITMPRGEGPFPALVLVHGSGPNDRDESVGPNKPFRDLAHGLATRGVAVLRYEKRTKVHGAALMHELGDAITLKEETIDDALEAVALLAKTSRVDGSRVFVLGHSLGGMALPRIARRAKTLRGMIVLGGSTQPLEDSVLAQIRYIAKLDGEVSAKERALLDALRLKVERVKRLNDASAPDNHELPLGMPTIYWLDMAKHRPTAIVAKEKRPILVLHGDRDYQVTLVDFEGWKKALARHPDATLKRYPNLNHLFIAGDGKSTPTEYQQPGHVAAQVVSDIADWIARHGSP